MPEQEHSKVPVWAFVLVLIALAVAGILLVQWQALVAWLAVLVLMTAFIVMAGRNIKGVMRGCLIDERRRISLSRLQLIAWTLLVLSAYFTAVVLNIRTGAADPLAVVIPGELWVLMGISATSLIGSPALLHGQRKAGDGEDRLARHDHAAEASWHDVFCGESESNNHYLDISRVQMFYFTFILVLAYGYFVGRMFVDAGRAGPGSAEIVELPAISAGMLALLGISHTAYLAKKGLPTDLEKQQQKRPAKRARPAGEEGE